MRSAARQLTAGIHALANLGIRQLIPQPAVAQSEHQLSFQAQAAEIRLRVDLRLVAKACGSLPPQQQSRLLVLL